MSRPETTVLVLQGGGALGAYQAGVVEALQEHGYFAERVAGISIGAINAAIICGNPPERRVRRLRDFWSEVSSWLPAPAAIPSGLRRLYDDLAAGCVMLFGVPGFFRPRYDWCDNRSADRLSVYDTAPLRARLLELVDFDWLNRRGPRLSIGAVDVKTGDFSVFDSARMRIGPEHVMASGALPPGFPPIPIDGRWWWDGGLVSNTPLQWVMESTGEKPLLVFQVDLFPAEGPVPSAISEIGQREKEIRYSSRTRLTTDRYRQLHDIQAAADRLAEKLPDEFRSDPDLALLRRSGPRCPISLVHLIYRKAAWEDIARDTEFSAMSMVEHWARGHADVTETLGHADWRAREAGRDGLQVFDLVARPAETGPRVETAGRAEDPVSAPENVTRPD